MRARPVAYVLLVLLAAGTLAVLGRQRETAHVLRDEIARTRTHAAELAHRRAKQQRLIEAQTNTEELERMLAERTTVAQLRKELDTLRQRAGAKVETKPAVEQAKTPAGLKGNVVAFQLWENAGRATPEATLETGLWAAATGDIDTLTNLLVFDPEARNEATTLFTRLPETLRHEFVSAERLIAVLAAKDVPLGSAAILNQYPTDTETKLAVQVFDTEGKHKVALLSLRPDDAGWRFVVPTNAVKRYAAWLQAPANAERTP